MNRLFSVGLVVSLAFFASSCRKKQNDTEVLAVEGADDTGRAKPRAIAPLSNGRPPQFVILSFDGAGDQAMLQDLIDVAKPSGARFTLFLSGVYFLTQETGGFYDAPRLGAGRSDIGFNYEGNGYSASKYIDVMIDKIVAARNMGFEMGTHYNGHFCGKLDAWGEADWQKELNEFYKLVNNSNKYVKHGNDSFKLGRTAVKGSRTPCLEGNKTVLRAFARKNGFTYDSSTTGEPQAWPVKIAGIWDFPLASIPVWSKRTGGFTDGPVLAMDYNLCFWHNNCETITNEDELRMIEERTYRTYLKYFETNYRDNRAPVGIGTHTSKWHRSAYWKAMLKFAAEVCKRPETVCGTYDELATFMDKYPNIGGGKWPRFSGDLPDVNVGGDDHDTNTPTPGALKVTQKTFLKRSTASSSDLGDNDKCAVEAGTVLNIASHTAEAGHEKVSFQAGALPNCKDWSEGYFFAGHVVLP